LRRKKICKQAENQESTKKIEGRKLSRKLFATIKRNKYRADPLKTLRQKQAQGGEAAPILGKTTKTVGGDVEPWWSHAEEGHLKTRIQRKERKATSRGPLTAGQKLPSPSQSKNLDRRKNMKGKPVIGKIVALHGSKEEESGIKGKRSSKPPEPLQTPTEARKNAIAIGVRAINGGGRAPSGGTASRNVTEPENQPE